MANKDLTFYSSENGDDWLLIGGTDEGDTVRHRSNPSSGGATRDIDVHDFLARERHTPQAQALWRILQTKG